MSTETRKAIYDISCTGVKNRELAQEDVGSRLHTVSN